MPDRGETSTSRKAARALPLTHRQHKAKKQPQTRVGATVSASSPRKATAGTRAKRVSAAKSSSTVELIDERGPEPSMIAPAVDAAVAEADRLEILSHVDTTLLVAPSAPAAEVTPIAASEPAPPPVAAEPMAQPRRKVRVRRKRPVVEQIMPDFTREDTVPLPALSIAQASQASLVAQTLSGPLATPVEATPAVEALRTRDAASAPQDELLEPTTILAPTTHLTHPTQFEPTTILEATTVLEPTKVLTSAAAGMDATTILEPTTVLNPLLAPASESELSGELDGDEHSGELEPLEPFAPRRPRMPTLAGMAALAPRADAEMSAQSVPDIEDLVPMDAEPEGALAENSLIEEPAIALEPLPAVAASEAPSERHRGIQGMWWPLAALRRSSPDTRPVAPPLPSLDEEIEKTAPHASARRHSAAVVDQAKRDGESHLSSERTPAPLHAGSSFMFDLPDVDESGVFYGRAPHMRHFGANRPQRTLVLTWTAGGHAAVASVAALIAVIAALRSGVTASALTVFVWALTLTMIAGIGAAIGYICLQVSRPKLATLALLMSQLAGFMWALALIGPRAALLALAPACVALALRGIGRASAVATAFAWMAVFIVDEVYTLVGGMAPALALNPAASALVDIALPLVGVWLVVNVLLTLYTSRLRVLAHGRALEHATLLSEAELSRLRMQVEDDAETLRRALLDASHGDQPERVYARGALSAVGDAVNDIADRLIDLRYDRAERKRLEAATRRLTRVIERAWLGLSWSWPDATGTILDDLLALLRTPPPPDSPALLDETTPTGQVVAPHLFRKWQPTEQRRDGEHVHAPQNQPETGPHILHSQPSQPSMPSLWPSNPGAGLVDPLELPPYPKWRSPDSRPSGWHEASDG